MCEVSPPSWVPKPRYEHNHFILNDLCTNNTSSRASCGELLIVCQHSNKTKLLTAMLLLRDHPPSGTDSLLLENPTLVGRGNKEASGMLVMFCVLFWTLVIWVCSVYKINRDIHLGIVYFSVCIWYFNTKHFKTWETEYCFLPRCVRGWLDNSYQWENKCYIDLLHLQSLGGGEWECGGD